MAAGAVDREELDRFWVGLEEVEKAGGVFWALTTMIVSGTAP